ncbi:MAG: alpha/beta hydrolase [Propionibacteriaceae bacterium]|jgi:acetyl esterase|nr:alpha/beta hydrolase [Propionibacteriaceae bacterium]
MLLDRRILEFMTPIIAAQAPYLDPTNPASHAERRRMLAKQHYQFFNSLSYPSYPNLTESDAQVETPSGSVSVRIFTPPAPAPRPGYLFFFGGAFWQRSFDSPDVVNACRRAAAEAEVTVIEIDYPLAPEYPYPAAVEAGYAVLQWMFEQADSLGLDPNRLAVGGQSSGANLAASTALYSRDHGGPALKLQILEVPVLDLTGSHFIFPPNQENTTDSTLPADFLEVLTIYGVADHVNEPYVSPLLAPDLTNLAPALILSAGDDLLRGDAEAYAGALSAVGVTVTQVTYSGQIHATPGLSPLIPAADAWRAQISHALQTWL